MALGAVPFQVVALTMGMVLCGLYTIHFVEQRRIAWRDSSFALRLPFIIKPRRRLRAQRDAIISDLENLVEKHGLIGEPAVKGQGTLLA